MNISCLKLHDLERQDYVYLIPFLGHSSTPSHTRKNLMAVKTRTMQVKVTTEWDDDNDGDDDDGSNNIDVKDHSD